MRPPASARAPVEPARLPLLFAVAPGDRPAAGRADRPQRRRQDQPARGDLVPQPRPRPARARASPRSTGSAAAPGASGARLEGPRGAVDLATGRVQDGERERRLVRDRRRARAEPGGARRGGERGLADPGDGPPVQRGRRRPAALPRPAGPGRRSGARRRSRELRPWRCASAPRLLRAGRPEPALARVLEERIAAAGVAIAAARREAIRGLGGALAAAPGWLPQPELALDGDGRGLAGRAARARRRGALRRGARRQPAAPTARAGTTAIGPHRSDLAGARPRHRARRARLLDRPAEGAADRGGAGRGAAARGGRRAAAAPAARRGRGPSRPRAPRARCSRSSARSAPRPG